MTLFLYSGRKHNCSGDFLAGFGSWNHGAEPAVTTAQTSRGGRWLMPVLSHFTPLLTPPEPNMSSSSSEPESSLSSCSDLILKQLSTSISTLTQTWKPPPSNSPKLLLRCSELPVQVQSADHGKRASCGANWANWLTAATDRPSPFLLGGQFFNTAL